jgi:3-deoxy-D-manno-octulosonate 8-phosphate phosphatase KdsC-like HAD superfamily phosphatase
MFQKLRSDLVRELSPIRLLLVNAGGFSSNGVNPSLSLGLNGNQIEQLRGSGVECIAFSGARSEDISSVAENLGIELHEAVSEITQFYSKMKAEFSLSDNEIAFICRDYADLPVMKNVSFTAVTPDAPLEVKSESYYAAYGVGGYAVREIASLIIKSKRYPNGWSE